MPENVRDIRDLIEELRKLKEKAALGGGPDRIKRQREKGKLTARERIERLVDHRSFTELDPFVRHRVSWFDMDKKVFLGDGVVTGYAKIDDRLVYVYSQDFTVLGGSLGEMHAKKIAKIYDLALKVGAPVVGLIDSGGARIQEGVNSLGGYGEIFYRNVRASGVIPQISAILGPCAGGAVYSPALTDFIVVVKGISYMFVTGPEVVKAATGVETTFEELGGAEIHSERSGVAHFIVDNEDNAFLLIRQLLSYLPSNNLEDPPIVDTEDPIDRETPEIESVLPTDPIKTYDVHEIILPVVDEGEFLEVAANFAPNAVVGFARLNGKTVGIVANQPAFLAGALDIDSSDKIARFVRFCDAFNIPIVTFVDVPGFLPGVEQEHGGIIRHGAKILYAYCEATVPRVTVILRKAYGGAYIAMNSRHIGADYVFALPTAEIAVMGPEGAVKILYRRKLASAENPEQLMKEFVNNYRMTFANPYRAAEMGYVDDVIEPSKVRSALINALETLETKRVSSPPRKHGNMPV
ncbi:MAG: acyl-CoA carboxylase subunit beta [Candidatus Njordarchaeum guaymaensis]